MRMALFSFKKSSVVFLLGVAFPFGMTKNAVDRGNLFTVQRMDLMLLT